MILENYRVTARGTIVFGTRQVQTSNGSPSPRPPAAAVVDDLARGFRARFPGLRDVAPQRAWGGWIGMTPTWLPVAWEASPNVLYSLGCNGHGFAQAQYLGHLLAGRLAGESMPEDLKAVWRGRRGFWPSPMRAPVLRLAWMADRLSDRLARR